MFALMIFWLPICLNVTPVLSDQVQTIYGKRTPSNGSAQILIMHTHTLLCIFYVQPRENMANRSTYYYKYISGNILIASVEYWIYPANTNHSKPHSLRIILFIYFRFILESQAVECSVGSFYTQRFQKRIHLHLPTDCFMKIFLQSTGLS